MTCKRKPVFDSSNGQCYCSVLYCSVMIEK